MAHLVFQTAFPGDLFLAIPLIKRLRAWDPATTIVLSCRPGLGRFLLEQGLVDELLEIDKNSSEGRRRAVAELRSREWDVVLVPHESVRTALWMRHVKARKAKIGFRKWWNSPFFDLRVQKPVEFPDALRQLSLMAPLDSRLAEWFGSDEAMRLKSPVNRESLVDFRQFWIPKTMAMRVLDKADCDARKIFFAPGSVWATKRWTASGYVELARLLKGKGYLVELVGSPDERGLCEEISAQVEGGLINHAGQTSLAQLPALLASGAALVCNDSGAMHAAAAAGVPIVSIFGPTTLDLGFRPWSDRALVVQTELKCRPCGKHGARTCPIGTHECMEKISAHEVLSALESLL